MCLSSLPFLFDPFQYQFGILDHTLLISLKTSLHYVIYTCTCLNWKSFRFVIVSRAGAGLYTRTGF